MAGLGRHTQGLAQDMALLICSHSCTPLRSQNKQWGIAPPAPAPENAPPRQALARAFLGLGDEEVGGEM